MAINWRPTTGNILGYANFLPRRTVITITASVILLPAQVDNFSVRSTAAAPVIVDLPVASPRLIGQRVRLDKAGAGAVTFRAQAADRVADSALGGTIANTQAAANAFGLELEVAEPGRWVVVAVAGIWRTT